MELGSPNARLRGHDPPPSDRVVGRQAPASHLQEAEDAVKHHRTMRKARVPQTFLIADTCAFYSALLG